MDENTEKIPRCAECKIEKTICRHEDGNGPVYCPTIKKLKEEKFNKGGSVAVSMEENV